MSQAHRELLLRHTILLSNSKQSADGSETVHAPRSQPYPILPSFASTSTVRKSWRTFTNQYRTFNKGMSWSAGHPVHMYRLKSVFTETHMSFRKVSECSVSSILLLALRWRDTASLNLSRDARKPVFGVSEQVRHELACTVTEAG